MTAKKRILYGVVFGTLALTMSAAQASTVIWDFNLPATATASQNPSYPSVARLTLEDTAAGVKFTLDPNEANPGYSQNSTVDALNIAYEGADRPSSDYANVSGPLADAETFGNNNPLVAVDASGSGSNMDSSYKSAEGQLLLRWDNPTFNVTDIAVWTILGTTIADNFSIFATSNSNPSPTFGIFSVSPISLVGVNPTPSNWVTGPTPVPLPAAVWLFGSGLLGLAGMGYWRGKKA